MWKFLIITLVLAAGGYAAWRYIPFRTTAAEEEKKDEGPKTAEVTQGELKAVVQASGRVVPNQEVEIKCKASGEVIKLPVDVSDTVKKDQLLVQLDPVDENRRLKQANVKLAGSQAKLEQARLRLKIAERELVTEKMRADASLRSAQARVDETKRKLERDRAMLEGGAASREEYEKALSSEIQAQAALALAKARFDELDTQKVQLDNLRQDIKIAEQQVESDQIAVSDADQRLKETTVLSPIDAVVADRKVQPGQIIASGINNVGGGTTVMTLADLSRIFVLASVDESDIGRVEPDQRASIVVDAYPDAYFPAKVVRVAPKGVNASNVVTFEVKVEVLGPRRRLLKPEMLATVSITVVDKIDVLLVPVASVERRRRDRFVTVVKEDGTQEDRQVEVGASDGEQMEIVSGVTKGEKVLLKFAGGQSRWQQSGDRDKARQERMKKGMQMRMMGGSRRR